MAQNLQIKKNHFKFMGRVMTLFRNLFANQIKNRYFNRVRMVEAVYITSGRAING